MIRCATTADNDALLELTRRTPMGGRIALRIDRDPDFFALTRHRGNGEVFVAMRGEQVSASLSVTLADVRVGGERVRAAYVSDLKSAGDPRVMLRLFGTATEYLRAHDVELVWCVIAAGNERVMPLLSGRAGLPPFAACGRFVVDELLNLNSSQSGAFDDDVDEDLHERFRATRELAQDYRRDDQGTMARLTSPGAATLELFNPESIKRNVLLGAPFMTRALLSIGRPVSAAIGGPPLPRIGDAVRLAYIRNFACEEPRALRSLIDRVRSIALQRGFTFTAIGLHERDPLRAILKGVPRFSFYSLLFAASFRGPSLITALQRGVPMQDYSVV